MAKEKVGEYLGNLQSPFAMKVLSCFVKEFDFTGKIFGAFKNTLPIPRNFAVKGHNLSNLIAIYNFQVNELINPCAFYFPTSEFLERHKKLKESWKNSGGITIVAIPKNMVQISATRAVE